MSASTSTNTMTRGRAGRCTVFGNVGGVDGFQADMRDSNVRSLGKDGKKADYVKFDQANLEGTSRV